eukprot:753038-Hanusia_phi.AAC.4
MDMSFTSGAGDVSRQQHAHTKNKSSGRSPGGSKDNKEGTGESCFLVSSPASARASPKMSGLDKLRGTASRGK